MQHEQAKLLFDKYRLGETTPEEKVMIKEYIFSQRGNPEDVLSEEELFEQLELLTKRVEKIIPKTNTKIIWASISAAAAIILMLSYTIHLWKFKEPTEGIVTGYSKIIQPGKNSAILFLANGNKIVLTDAKNGQLASESGVTISKTSSGQIIYTVKSKPNSSAKNIIQYNTIETPNGGQYMVCLPDGSKVWLNAATTIKFPTQFTDVTRKVELSGEAYFEVTKDKKHPFLVEGNHQQVQVLGTHFNISSYPNDPAIKTTLLEGSVKVSLLNLSGKRNSQSIQNAVVLSPGQKSTLKNNSLQISKANIQDELDWKDGYFRLDNETFKSVMNKIARWYNVEVIYETNPDHISIGGMIPRSEDIKSVLTLMGQTGEVHFKIEGRRITIIR